MLQYFNFSCVCLMAVMGMALSQRFGIRQPMMPYMSGDMLDAMQDMYASPMAMGMVPGMQMQFPRRDPFMGLPGTPTGSPDPLSQKGSMRLAVDNTINVQPTKRTLNQNNVPRTAAGKRSGPEAFTQTGAGANIRTVIDHPGAQGSGHLYPQGFPGFIPLGNPFEHGFYGYNF